MGRNNITGFFALCGVLIISGCIKTSTREIILPDQQVSGNQGYLLGVPAAAKRGIKKKTIIDLEISIPNFKKPHLRKPLHKQAGDRDVWGNQGYLYKEEGKASYVNIEPIRSVPIEKPAFNRPSAIKPLPAGKPQHIKKHIKKHKSSSPDTAYIKYKVRSGDTLWSIAKNFYGKAGKWKIIYNSNKGQLKDPGFLKPGTVLNIPVASGTNINYIK